MKHYKAISRLNQVISDLQVELERLGKLDSKMEGYAGYIFIQEDKNNISEEIKDLTQTMKDLIELSK
tara:strand:+ start:10344 stop:10544 length:201 start_codon:yes stop_codon:yes gene_type:complete